MIAKIYRISVLVGWTWHLAACQCSGVPTPVPAAGPGPVLIVLPVDQPITLLTLDTLQIDAPRVYPVNRYAARKILRQVAPKAHATVHLGVQAVAEYETHYGQGWKGEGKGSNNWGAIHATRCDPDHTFPAKDTLPDGTGYEACFRWYDSPAEGARDLVREIERRPAALEALEAGDLEEFATVLYETEFYHGKGATSEARIRYYAGALAGKITKICAAMRGVDPCP